MLNFYLPFALTCLPLFLPFGGEILFGDLCQREERLICEFKGVKEWHIRFFNIYYVVCARIV
jgi:hypothetical protein